MRDSKSSSCHNELEIRESPAHYKESNKIMQIGEDGGEGGEASNHNVTIHYKGMRE